MATQAVPVRGVAYTLDLVIRKDDGTIIANPTISATRVAKDGNASAAATNAAACYDTTYGLCSVALTAAEMTADRVVVEVVSSSTSALPTVVVLATAGQSLDDIDTEVDAIYALVDTEVAAIKAKTDNLPASPANEVTLVTTGVKVATNADKVGYELTAAYDTTAQDVAALILTTPANKLKTDANGFVTYNNVIVQGGGADAVTLALGSLAAGAEVWLTTDDAGEEVVANGVAGDTGDVTFYLDAGTTYYRWAKKPGVNFTNPAAFVAVAD